MWRKIHQHSLDSILPSKRSLVCVCTHRHNSKVLFIQRALKIRGGDGDLSLHTCDIQREFNLTVAASLVTRAVLHVWVRDDWRRRWEGGELRFLIMLIVVCGWTVVVVVAAALAIMIAE